MRRFYLPPDQWPNDWFEGQAAALVGDEAHHCRRVMRVECGDEIEVIDGAGRSARVRVERLTGGRVELAALEPSQMLARPSPRVHLACAVAKGKNLELVIQKATELGVDRITPLITERTIARPGSGGQPAGKLAKWQRIGVESTKQCGRKWLPQIVDPVPWHEFLAMVTGNSSICFLASLEPGSQSLRDHFEVLGGEQVGQVEEIVFAVGPEGDFTLMEYQAARGAGFLAVDLGTLVLRAETAAIAGLAVLASELRRFCPCR